MNVSDAMDSLPDNSLFSLSSTTIDEREFLKSVCKLLYRTKSVKKATLILDTILNPEIKVSSL